MPKFKVLHTDCRWGDADVERDILREVDAELTVAPSYDPETLAGLVADCDAIMTCWAPVPESVVAAAPRCQIVARFGIGLDNIDVDYCTTRGIPITNVPDYCTAEVAEHAMALLLALARRVAYFHHETKSGRYDLSAAAPMARIEGQTLGIVGLGNTGRRLAKKAAALDLNVLVTGRSKPESLPAGSRWVALDELLTQSDFVSLHVPLTEETRHLIGAEQLSLMKPTSYIINTARGGLLDHAALSTALSKNRLAGAALDVQDPEPPDMSQAPFNDPRVIVTPHAAFLSKQSLTALRTRTARAVVERLSGRVPEHVVNPQALESS
jgi:D-3-phosphoglycerate dehydrogenase